LSKEDISTIFSLLNSK